MAARQHLRHSGWCNINGIAICNYSSGASISLIIGLYSEWIYLNAKTLDNEITHMRNNNLEDALVAIRRIMRVTEINSLRLQKN